MSKQQSPIIYRHAEVEFEKRNHESLLVGRGGARDKQPQEQLGRNLTRFLERVQLELSRFEIKRSFRKRNHPLVLGLIMPGQLITVDARNFLRFKYLFGKR
ncbi:hypothetical protein [Roseivirga sp.]|uniref:hypothetical protein n=1 Tax=Roseivirga sp. TaxID=1964215 RepID=UPI002B276CAA|nr:hypothetical protein [Roseivirga sp.]